jgi:hypothetical protein
MKDKDSRKQALNFSNELIDWFWEHGVTRRNEYSLSPSRWLQPLYESRDSLEMVSREENPRPANAIWGPSQTGKSTLVAKYIDASNQNDKGEGTALHWPKGAAAFFSLPRGQEPSSIKDDSIVLNPYNGGMDASACITRFTKGSIERKEGFSHVSNPMFPVMIQLSSAQEVMLSVARGYDGQCDLLQANRFWNLTLLKQTVEKFGSGKRNSTEKMNRNAYEQAIELCEVLQDLAVSGLSRFRGLLSPDGKMDEAREIILQSIGLYEEKRRIEKFRNEILWDQSSIISDFYNRLWRYREKVLKKWKGRAIHASLEATSCFLDMDSYSMFSKNIPNHAKDGSKEVKVHRILSSLAFKEEDGNVYLGTCDVSGHLLFENATEFGMFQGLIQEVVVPLNTNNLQENSFRNYIQKYDLLDFPGVERGGRSSTASKVALDKPDKETVSSLPWDELFSKVLKRGKTASLFQGYAKKMLLDAVSIFQDLDNDKPNAQDLITGVSTWWKSTEPKYDVNAGDRSPLPLNCVLTWWSKMLNESPANSASIFGKNKTKYRQLGFLVDPSVANLVAINDFTLPRGSLNKDTLRILPKLLDAIGAEPEYKELFSQTPKANSVDNFLNAKDGGMDAFFELLITQVHSSGMRNLLWEKKANEAAVVLEKLLCTKGLLPKGKSLEKDRIKNLEVLRELLSVQLESNDHKFRNEAEACVKFLFNVNSQDLEDLPVKKDEINASYLRRQFNSEGAKLFASIPSSKEVCWKKLGFNSEDQAQLTWQALCASIEPSMQEIVNWLRRMVVQRNKFKNLDFRKFLAVKMTNQFFCGNGDVHSGSSRNQGNESNFPQNPILYSSRNRLGQFLKLKIAQGSRDEQPGDDEIKMVCGKFHGKNTEGK